MNINIVDTDKNFKDILPVFATEKFLNIKSNEYGWFVSDTFILPYYIDRRFIFSKLVFTSETIYLDEKIDKNLEKKFLAEVIKLSKELNMDLIGQPTANVVFNVYPNKCKYIEWGSYVIDLTLDEQDILKNMHSKHRNVIRKALKDGVIIEKTENTKIIYENLKKTMLRQNRAYPSVGYLEKLKKFSLFFIAKKNGEVQGCCVLPYNKEGAYYLFGGSISKPYTGSLNLMHYEAMLYLKRIGIKKYDFMGARPNVEKGSKLEGIQRFKSRFGGNLRKGYLWKYEFKPFKIVMMKNLQKIIYKLKKINYLGDAIDQERKK